MKCEIISIGSELTSGQNLDTNSQWLSRRLAEAGIPVAFHTTVADDFDANVDVFRTAVGRADLVLASGGLGPTQDDLTREVLARDAGRGAGADRAGRADDPRTARGVRVRRGGGGVGGRRRALAHGAAQDGGDGGERHGGPSGAAARARAGGERVVPRGRRGVHE